MQCAFKEASSSVHPREQEWDMLGDRRPPMLCTQTLGFEAAASYEFS